MLEYKGFKASIQYCINLHIYQAEVINVSDVITFGASHLADLQPLLEKSVDQYLEYKAWRQSLIGEADMADEARPILKEFL
ncbi:MAG: hypothetical protein U1E78_00555 [Gammaproteobacteria bacterium]